MRPITRRTPARVLRHARANAVAYAALFMACGGVSYAATLAPANSVNSQAIIDGQVQTADLAPDAIHADEFCLAGSCVGSKEVASHAIASNELAGGAVGTAQLGSAAVTTAKLAAGAVGTGQLAGSAVRSAQVADGSLTNADIAPNSLTGAAVQDGGLSPADIAGGTTPPAYLAPISATVGRDARETKTLASLQLPAGRYLVKAEMQEFGIDSDRQPGSCSLAGGTFDGEGSTYQNAMYDVSGDRLPVLVEGLISLSDAATVSVSCNQYRAGFQGYLNAIAVR